VLLEHLKGLRGATTTLGKRIAITPHEHRYRAAEEFALGHEIAHHHIPEGMAQEAQEAFCDRVSAALLLPKISFLASLAERHFDLPAVRRDHPWASWQVIFWRAAELVSGTSAAVWKDGIPFDCRCARPCPQERPSSTELTVVRLAVSRRGHAAALDGGALAMAWDVPRGRVHWVYCLMFPV